MGFKPRPIQAYNRGAAERWGKQEENRRMLYPTGIEPIDQALSGINLMEGELWVIQGEEKMRKTTLVHNIIINGQMWAAAQKRKAALENKPEAAPVHPLVVVDMLEPGVKGVKFYDMTIANVASRILISQGHNPDPGKSCNACSTAREKTPCKELRLTYKFLRFNTRSAVQQLAIDMAQAEVEQWRMHIYGPTEEEGDTTNLEASMARWVALCKEHEKVIFVTDHIQQYTMPALGDYETQLRVVPALSNIVAKHGAVVIALSQVSLTSARNAAMGGEKLTAAGGRKAAQAANIIISTNYADEATEMMITVENARDMGAFGIWQPLDMVSGAFHGTPRRVKKMDANRPGAHTAPQNGR